MRFIIFVVGILYFYFISNTVYGGDSGDLLAAILTNGSAHPPGYPLYTLLGILFNKLPIPYLTTAGKVTIISTLSTISSLVLVYKILKEISAKDFNKKYALLTLFTLGFNYLLWLYSVVPEVFPLNSLMVLLTFYLAICFYKRNELKYLLAITFLYALAVTHHHTFIFITPSLLFLFLPKFKSHIKPYLNIKSIAKIMGVFLLGLVPLLHLVIAAKTNSLYQWGDTDNIRGFIAMLLRENYGTFIATPNVLTIPQSRLRQFFGIFTATAVDFTYIGFTIALLGIMYILLINKSQKKLLLAVLINMFFFGPFFVFYANFPLLNDFYLATIERFFHAYYFFVGICLYFGFLCLEKGIDLLKKRKYLKELSTHVMKYGLFILLLLIPITLFIRNVQSFHNLKNNFTAERLAQDILRNTEENSIVFLNSDTTAFNTAYYNLTEENPFKKRVIVHISKVSSKFYQDALQKHYPDIKFDLSQENINGVNAFLIPNLETYQFYSETPINLKELEEDYMWVFVGSVYKLQHRESFDKAAYINTVEEFWSSSQNQKLIENTKNKKTGNLFSSDISRTYMAFHEDTALAYLSIEEHDRAYKHIQNAIILNKNDDFSRPYHNYLLALYFYRINSCKEAEEYVMATLTEQQNDTFIALFEAIGMKCFNDSPEEKTRYQDQLRKLLEQNLNPLEEF